MLYLPHRIFLTSPFIALKDLTKETQKMPRETKRRTQMEPVGKFIEDDKMVTIVIYVADVIIY